MPCCFILDIINIAQKVVNRIYDGVSTIELDELAARTCASAITEDPKFGELASRIIVSNNHKNTSPSFSETIYILYHNKNIFSKFYALSSFVISTFFATFFMTFCRFFS